ncbi:hypothetical protein GCM10010518_14110 [Kitasatospora cinereorecta]
MRGAHCPAPGLTAGLPEQLWNVDLCPPGGAFLYTVDAYRPEQAVPGRPVRSTSASPGSGSVRSGSGVTVTRVGAKGLREAMAHQAVPVRTAMRRRRTADRPRGWWSCGGPAAKSGVSTPLVPCGVPEAVAGLRHVRFSPPSTLYKPLSFTKG